MQTRGLHLAVALVVSLYLLSSTILVSQSQSQQQASASKEFVTEIPASEVQKHFAKGERTIHHSEGQLNTKWWVELKLVVAPDGAVLSATPLSGLSAFYDDAAALARTWRYIPFENNGVPTYVTFSASVLVAPPERRPVERILFPKVKKLDSLQMTLERTDCYGTCPAYKIQVHGDGSVIYNGEAYVPFCGEYRGKISPSDVQRLLGKFAEADYFNLFDRYVANATDLPTYTTSITFDDRKKSVVDYWGLREGMPDVVSELETMIDRVAGPQVWAKGDSHMECESSFIPVTTSHVPPKIE